MVWRAREFVSTVLLGTGVLAVLAPLFLYRFIHGDSDRYMWIINGPPPFDSFGSGPFQRLMYVGLLIVGCLLIGGAILVRGSRCRRVQLT